MVIVRGSIGKIERQLHVSCVCGHDRVKEERHMIEARPIQIIDKPPLIADAARTVKRRFIVGFRCIHIQVDQITCQIESDAKCGRPTKAAAVEYPVRVGVRCGSTDGVGEG